MTVDEYAEAYTKHHKAAEAICECLTAAGDEERAKRIMGCGTYTTGFVCPSCGEFHVFNTRLCRDRLCPNCEWVLARKRAQATLRALAQLRAMTRVEIFHMVLTLQHERWSDLRSMLQQLTGAYGRLMRSDLFKHIYGSVRSIEITFHEEHGFHPHIHALVCAPTDAPQIAQETLSRAWRHELGVDYDPQVHFKPTYASDGTENSVEAVFEACKYALKPQIVEELDAPTLRYFSDAIKGVRLTSAHGLLRLLLRQQREGETRPTDGCASCTSQVRPQHRALYWNYALDELCEDRPF